MKEATKVEDEKRLENIFEKISLLDRNTYSTRKRLDDFTSKTFGYSSQLRDNQIYTENDCFVNKILKHLDALEENLHEIHMIVNHLNSEIEWRK